MSAEENSFDVTMGSAQELHAAGRYDDVARFYQTGTEQSPDDSERARAIRGRAVSEHMRGNAESAVDLARTALRIHSQQLPPHRYTVDKKALIHDWREFGQSSSVAGRIILCTTAVNELSGRDAIAEAARPGLQHFTKAHQAIVIAAHSKLGF